MRAMSDEIGYRTNDEDIAKMIEILKATYPEDANEDYARLMLIEMKLSLREMGSIDEDFLHQMKAKVDSQING
jgi:hypothetical protein